MKARNKKIRSEKNNQVTHLNKEEKESKEKHILRESERREGGPNLSSKILYKYFFVKPKGRSGEFNVVVRY